VSRNCRHQRPVTSLLIWCHGGHCHWFVTGCRSSRQRGSLARDLRRALSQVMTNGVPAPKTAPRLLAGAGLERTRGRACSGARWCRSPPRCASLGRSGVGQLRRKRVPSRGNDDRLYLTGRDLLAQPTIRRLGSGIWLERWAAGWGEAIPHIGDKPR
jgi:hypothetical protein